MVGHLPAASNSPRPTGPCAQGALGPHGFPGPAGSMAFCPRASWSPLGTYRLGLGVLDWDSGPFLGYGVLDWDAGGLEYFCGLGLLFRVSGLEGWASGLLNENGCCEIVWLPLTLWLSQEWHVT